MASPILLYIVTVMIWGTTWFAIEFQLGYVAPEVSLVYRFGIAAASLLLFCILTGRSLVLTQRDHVFVALQGATLFSGNYLIFYHATGYLTSGLVAVVFSAVMFMNMLNGAMFLKRRVERRVLIGACFGLLGITCIFWPEIMMVRESPASADTVRGLLLSVAATYLASVGNIISARNQQLGLPVMQTNAWGMFYGVIIMLVFSILSGAEFVIDWRLGYLVSLLYLAIFGSVFAFGAYLTLIGRVGADRAAYAGVLFPIVALVISSLFEDFRWSLLATAGVGSVLLGNLLVLGMPTRKLD